MRGELVDEDTVSLFHGEIMKRGRLKQSIDKSIDRRGEGTSGGDRRLVRRDPIFRTLLSSSKLRCFLLSRSFVSNEFVFNNRNQIGDEYLHFLVYRNVCVDVCLRREVGEQKYGARFEILENRI